MALTARGKSIFWLVAVVVLVADLSTKWWVVSARLGVDPSDLVPDQSCAAGEPILGESFKLVALLNPGMMWGTFKDFPLALKLFRLVALLVVLYLYLEIAAREWLGLSALGAILGGAIGNIYDSFTYGGVRDFLHFDLGFFPFDPWPAFNVADASICVGVATLALVLLRRPHSQPNPGEPNTEVANGNSSGRGVLGDLPRTS
ncbi:MAG: signal peptidase II [Planctomycetota bacterium]